MFDPEQLLDQVLGASAGGGLPAFGEQIKGRLDSMSGSGGFTSGAAIGGVLGLLLGNKSVRNMGGGLLGYGGAAAIGALAMRAYQAYKSGQDAAPMSVRQIENLPTAALPHAAPATDGTPFELVLIKAMVAAAKADGHIDADEQRRLFSEVERLGLDSEAKAYLFDLLTQPVDLASIAACVTTPEQGAELYLASRLAIDPDQPAERAHLDTLATMLKLPDPLRTHLDNQVSGA